MVDGTSAAAPWTLVSPRCTLRRALGWLLCALVLLPGPAAGDPFRWVALDSCRQSGGAPAQTDEDEIGETAKAPGGATVRRSRRRAPPAVPHPPAHAGPAPASLPLTPSLKSETAGRAEHARRNGLGTPLRL